MEVNSEKWTAKWADKDVQRTIRYICGRYAKQMHPDDLEQLGRIALWKCLRTHDDSIQKLTTSLTTYLHWEIRRELRKELMYKKRKSQWEDREKERQKGAEQEREKGGHDILAYFDGIPPVYKEVLFNHFVLEQSLDDIGRRWKRKKNWTSRVLREGIRMVFVNMGLEREWEG